MRARIELVGCMSHSARGRTAQKGMPFYSTNAADIAYYQTVGEYRVSILDAPKAKPAPKPAPKAAPKPEPKPETPPPPPPEDDEEDPETDEASEEIETDEDDVPVYTKTDLEKMTKAALAELAAEDFDVELDADNLRKSQMVAAILKAQIEAASA